MNLNIDLASIILMITVIQGVYLGGVLIFGRTREHPSTLLGLALVFFSMGLVYDVIRHNDLLSTNPELYFLPIKLYYLPAPLAYFFARKLTPDPLRAKDYIWLVPAIVEFSILTILFVLPVEMKSTIESHGESSALYFEIYRHLWIPFSILLLFKCYGIISKNRDRFMNFFSGSQDQLMKWAMRSSLYTALFCCSFLSKFFVSAQAYDTYFFPLNAIFIMVLVFSLGTWGIKQSFIDFDYEEFIEYQPDSIQGVNDSQSEADKSEKEETSGMLVLETLRMFIEKNKPYRDPELSLDTLSKSSKLPARQISSSINKFADMNFNTFINQFRVDEAKRMLRDDQYNHLNILGIGFEVGFNSKATFYAVFKKQTGMTPAKWQKQTN